MVEDRNIWVFRSLSLGSGFKFIWIECAVVDAVWLFTKIKMRQNIPYEIRAVRDPGEDDSSDCLNERLVWFRIKTSDRAIPCTLIAVYRWFSSHVRGTTRESRRRKAKGPMAVTRYGSQFPNEELTFVKVCRKEACFWFQKNATVLYFGGIWNRHFYTRFFREGCFWKRTTSCNNIGALM